MRNWKMNFGGFFLVFFFLLYTALTRSFISKDPSVLARWYNEHRDVFFPSTHCIMKNVKYIKKWMIVNI